MGEASNKRTWVLMALVLAGLAGLAYRYRDRGPASLYQASPDQPTVVFVVLDTVRADHTSLCGYHRPTTPVLESLVERGAQHSCRAITPGGWTVPSHASYFTGVDVPTHGVHFATLGDVAEMLWDRSATVRPLGPELPTLAEEYAKRGYQTYSFSANPLISAVTGLDRGFDVVRTSSDPIFWWSGETIASQVRWALRTELDRDRPLFLFVNLGDAHAPWREVPDGLGWVDPAVRFSPDPKWAFMGGELDAAASAAMLERRTNLYDYGMSSADAALGSILDELELLGWNEAGLRVVVIGDHGELLGEHDLLDHGVALYEPNNRVPLLVWGSDVAELPPPDTAISGLVTHALALDVPAPSAPITSVQHERQDMAKRGVGVGDTMWAGIWKGEHKLLWHHGRYESFDLAADPQELHPREVADDDPLRAELDVYLERALRSKSRSSDGEVDPSVLEQLKAMGYVED